MVGVSFNYPYVLFLLFLIPVFIIIYFLSILYNKKRAILFSNFEALSRISDVEIFSKGISTFYINLAVVLLLVFAAAGTVISFEAKSSVSSYVIMIDNSVSMKTADVGDTRMETAKRIAENFIDSSPVGTEFAVLQFSGEINVLQRLDSSKLKTRLAVSSANLGEIQGTNLYSAIITADGLLGNRKQKSVLILSDGQFNLGDNDKAEEYIVKNNIIVNAVLVGTEEGGETELGSVSRVDESVLKKLAFDTEGTLFRTDSSGKLDMNMEKILTLAQKTVYLDLSIYFLVVSLALILINWILYNFRFKSIP